MKSLSEERGYTMSVSVKNKRPLVLPEAAAKIRGIVEAAGFAADLNKGILRTAADPKALFQKDPLKILQGIRFAVAYDLDMDYPTERALLSQSALLEKLPVEQVYDELCKLLVLVEADDLIWFAPVLAVVIPELKPMIGFDQKSPHHAYDLYTHVARVVAGVPGDPTLRWAALLHDIGKVSTFTVDETGRGHFYDHAAKGAEMADAILKRLKAPTDLREQVVLLIEKHMLWLQPEKKPLRRQIGRLGLGTVYQLLSLQLADNSNKGTAKSTENEQYVRILKVLEEIQSEGSCLGLKDLAVDRNDLMQIGFSGQAVSAMLNWLLDQVIDETLPNERGVLLAWAKGVWITAWRSS